MAVTVTSQQSWGSRLKGAFKGIFVGLVFVPLAAWLLFANEGAGGFGATRRSSRARRRWCRWAPSGSTGRTRAGWCTFPG